MMHRAAALAIVLAGTALPAAAQQTTPPPALPARPIQFPPFTERTLPNGLRLLVVENHSLPLVNLDLYIRSGTGADPAQRLGTASIVASMLDKGTATRSATQIAEQVEGVGGVLGAGADQDNLTVSASMLSDQLQMAFELLSDVALHPAFAEQELQTVRAQQLAGLRAAQGNSGYLASRTFEERLFGAQHPYGRRPTPASVTAITREDLAAWHRTHFVPANAMLVVSGDVTPARAEQMARAAFGAWTGGAAPADNFPNPPAHERAEILLVNRPGSVQSSILVGNPGLSADSPDYYAGQVLNMILGASGESRLERILRGEHGWTYSSRSRYARLLGGGDYRANTEVRTAVTDSALSELVTQLRRIRDEAVPQAELDQAKNFLISSFPNTLETPGQVAGRIAGARLLGLPASSVTEYPQRVAAVTAADVQRVARRYLNPDRATIVVVGDASQILERVRAIAPVTVLDLEGNPVDPATIRPAAN